MAPKLHTISVTIAKELKLSKQEAGALKDAYQTSTAQVLKSPKRRELINFETNDPPIGGTRRPTKTSKKRPRKYPVKK